MIGPDLRQAATPAGEALGRRGVAVAAEAVARLDGGAVDERLHLDRQPPPATDREDRLGADGAGEIGRGDPVAGDEPDAHAQRDHAAGSDTSAAGSASMATSTGSTVPRRTSDGSAKSAATATSSST